MIKSNKKITKNDVCAARVEREINKIDQVWN